MDHPRSDCMTAPAHKWPYEDQKHALRTLLFGNWPSSSLLATEAAPSTRRLCFRLHLSACFRTATIDTQLLAMAQLRDRRRRSGSAVAVKHQRHQPDDHERRFRATVPPNRDPPGPEMQDRGMAKTEAIIVDAEPARAAPPLKLSVSRHGVAIDERASLVTCYRRMRLPVLALRPSTD